MTILEKQGPSTASFSSEEDNLKEYGYPNEKSGYDAPEPAMPPSYTDSVPSPSANARASSSRPTGPPPSNHVSISQTNDKIVGTWNLDTSLRVPESLLKPLAPGQTDRPNLYLHTRNGSIQADVALFAGTTQPATIEVDTWNGKVTATVTSRINSQPFKLKATTRNGDVKITLPLDFIGPIKYSTRHGRIKFSDDLQNVTSVFTDGTAFVGDWQAAGFVDFASWHGDEVEVETANGKIMFAYLDDRLREVPRSPVSPAPAPGAKLKKRGGLFGRH